MIHLSVRIVLLIGEIYDIITLDMGDHRVLFIFSEQSDVNKVLAGEPWSFDKNLVALKRIGCQT